MTWAGTIRKGERTYLKVKYRIKQGEYFVKQATPMLLPLKSRPKKHTKNFKVSF